MNDYARKFRYEPAVSVSINRDMSLRCRIRYEPAVKILNWNSVMQCLFFLSRRPTALRANVYPFP
jgi:hypothetical protein